MIKSYNDYFTANNIFELYIPYRDRKYYTSFKIKQIIQRRYII